MRRLILSAVLCAAALPVLSQSAVPEPQLPEAFFGLSDNRLVPLERETAAIHASGGGFIVAKSRAVYEIPGAKSPVRFHSGAPVVFLIRSALAQLSIDPSTQYMLRRLDSKKKDREIVFMTGHFSPVGSSSQTDFNAGQIAVSFARVGESSYQVTASSLPPGEYALSRSYGQDMFCFGVD